MQATREPMSGSVLIVCDDPGSRVLLQDYLQGRGFTCRTADTVDAMFEVLARDDFALVILDVTRSGDNGFVALAALRRLRDVSQVPVIMLTARGADVDRALGLELGADDYVSKPFNPRELVARMHAILRRAEIRRIEQGPLLIGELELDPAARRLFIAGIEIALTSSEYNVFEVLARSAGKTVTRDVLYREALAREAGPHDRSIDVHVASLRRKLGEWPDGSERIATVRGVGYVLTVFRRK